MTQNENSETRVEIVTLWRGLPPEDTGTEEWKTPMWSSERGFTRETALANMRKFYGKDWILHERMKITVLTPWKAC